MELKEKYKIKELLGKARYKKGKNLTKKEMLDVVGGYLKLKLLGIYEPPKWSENARRDILWKKKP